MKHTFLAASLAAFLLCAPAYAHSHDDAHESAEAEEVTQHYEAPEPKTKEEAFSEFDKADKEIRSLSEKEKLEDNDLERVHELSYALRNSVETLRLNAKTPEQTGTIDKLADLVENLHEAAEEHEAAEVKTQAAALQPVYAEVKKLLSGE